MAIIMDLITWMKKCLVFAPIWIKRVSMEGSVLGFFGGRQGGVVGDFEGCPHYTII